MGRGALTRSDREEGRQMNNGIYCSSGSHVYYPLNFQWLWTPDLRRKRIRKGSVKCLKVWNGPMFFDDGITAICETSYVKNQSLMRAEAATVGLNWIRPMNTRPEEKLHLAKCISRR